ncbi:DEAD/DEAH box helicase [Patescibacteria group bacterium]|nr:DEAD/DEAH box helicase [Patescibacteria group bacterium]
MSFKDLNLIPQLERAIAKQGYTIPTPIQAQSIPGLLSGKDLIGIAQTGTGKTAAFILPILQKMTEKHPRVIQALVLAPTRELAAQIGDSFSAYGEFLNFRHTVIFGGVRQGRQVQALSGGIDILAATPGRLLDLLQQKRLNLDNVEFFVLDEADRMLDMGFLPDIKKIITKLPSQKQSLFFSATMSTPFNNLAKSLLKNPIQVDVAPETKTVERIKQYVFFIDSSSKGNLLLELLRQKNLASVLVFTRTKHKANKVAIFLSKNKISATAIHGNKSQNARTKAIHDFKTGRIKILVATDIAARGIDIDNISHVINFELPNEAESYIHRIGRTARAGAEGTAFSFCAADERNFLRDIETLIGQKIPIMDHSFHSETAKNAVGPSARPLPQKPFGNNAGFKHKSFPASKNKNYFSKNAKSGNRFKRSPKKW